jgi:pantoate kinase
VRITVVETVDRGRKWGGPGAKIDGRKTEEFREAARARARAQWTPHARAAHAELMRSPEVLERMLAGTKFAKECALQLRTLHEAWRASHESVRLQFLAEKMGCGHDDG